MPFDIIFKNANITDETKSYSSDIGLRMELLPKLETLMMMLKRY